MDNLSIKENIRKARKKCGLTQEDMAHELGISITAYRDLEKGPTAIINGNIPKISGITGTPLEELLLGFSPMPSDGLLEDVQAEYGNRLASLQTRIADLEKLVRSQEETIRYEEEIIIMLKKIIDGKE